MRGDPSAQSAGPRGQQRHEEAGGCDPLLALECPWAFNSPTGLTLVTCQACDADAAALCPFESEAALRTWPANFGGRPSLSTPPFSSTPTTWLGACRPEFGNLPALDHLSRDHARQRDADHEADREAQDAFERDPAQQQVAEAEGAVQQRHHGRHRQRRARSRSAVRAGERLEPGHAHCERGVREQEAGLGEGAGDMPVQLVEGL